MPHHGRRGDRASRRATAPATAPLGVVPSSRSDEDLLELVALRRDETAFDELYGRYSRAVYTLVVRLIADRAGSEDVVQQAFINVWRAATGYRRERGPAKSWLYTIARNAAFDALRLRAAAGQWQVPDLPDEGPGPDQRASAAEEAFHVHAAVDRLPDHEREVIELAYFHGLSQSEVAARLGAPLGTIKTAHAPRARPPGRPSRSGAGVGMRSVHVQRRG